MNLKKHSLNKRNLHSIWLHLYEILEKCTSLLGTERKSVVVWFHAAAAAAAKSLQSCLTLCDPRDGSPPGSPVPGILQARTLEWVAISFSNAWKWKVKMKSLSHVWLFTTPWTAAHQAPPSMGFSRQEYWSGVPSPLPLKSRTPQSHPWRLGSASSKLLLVLIYLLTSSHQSQMFLMASTRVNPFQKVFSWLCPDPPAESLFMAAIALQNIFVKISPESQNDSLIHRLQN